MNIYENNYEETVYATIKLYGVFRHTRGEIIKTTLKFDIDLCQFRYSPS